jgi:hypothetical protein
LEFLRKAPNFLFKHHNNCGLEEDKMKSVLNSKFVLLSAIQLLVTSANAGLGFSPGSVDYRLRCVAETQETRNPSLVDFIEAGGTWAGVGDDTHLLQLHITKYADQKTANVYINVPIYDEPATLQFHSHFSGLESAQAEAKRFSIYKKYNLQGIVENVTSSPDSLENLNESDVLADKSGVEINHLRIKPDQSDSKVLEVSLSTAGGNFEVSTTCSIIK